MKPMLVLFAVCGLVSAAPGQPPGTNVFLPDTLDVGVRTIVAPTDSLDSGSVVTPACSVYNYGDQTASSYKVRFRIGVYRDSATVDGHLPGTARLVEFAAWTAGTRGMWYASCSTELVGDGNPANNKKTDTLIVNVKDVGVTRLTIPAAGDTYPKDTAVTPKATWRNHGTRAASFETWMILLDPIGERVYAKRVTIPSLAPGGSIQVGSFPRCTLRTAGEWTVRCSTYMDGDSVRSNDTLSSQFFVLGEVGVEENFKPQAPSCKPTATIVRGMLFLSRDMTELPGNSDRVQRPALVDAAGRRVIDLHPGSNDVSSLCPGVYFVRAVSRGPSAATKVVVAR